MCTSYLVHHRWCIWHWQLPDVQWCSERKQQTENAVTFTRVETDKAKISSNFRNSNSAFLL